MTYSLSSDIVGFSLDYCDGIWFWVQVIYAVDMSCCIVEKLVSGEGRQASREAAETERSSCASSVNDFLQLTLIEP